jgi:hypothetical protein
MTSKLIDAARRRGQARTAQVEIDVNNAMTTMQKEINENGGIYPRNGGAVSMNEVARRADISQTTLFSPKQKILGQAVKAWIESLKNKQIVGRTRARRTLYERSEDWRKKYLALQDTYILTELELQDAIASLENLREDIKKLHDENIELTQQVRACCAVKHLNAKNHKI